MSPSYFTSSRCFAGSRLREDGVIPDVLQDEQLFAVIEPAMSSSIQMYVDSRDFAAPRSEAQHIGFLTTS